MHRRNFLGLICGCSIFSFGFDAPSMVLEPGMKFTPITGADIKREALWLEMRTYSRDEIAPYFAIPPGMLSGVR